MASDAIDRPTAVRRRAGSRATVLVTQDVLPTTEYNRSSRRPVGVARQPVGVGDVIARVAAPRRLGIGGPSRPSPR